MFEDGKQSRDFIHVSDIARAFHLALDADVGELHIPKFSIPAEGPSDATVRDVLAATGEVEFVPLPPEDYGDGGLTAELGSPPAGETFRSGHLSAVVGLRLADGRAVVVKVRPDSSRMAGCAAAASWRTPSSKARPARSRAGWSP